MNENPYSSPQQSSPRMDAKRRQITLTTLFVAVSLSCVTVGICVAWPHNALTLLVGMAGVAVVGGLLLSAWFGFLCAMATVVVVVAVFLLSLSLVGSVYLRGRARAFSVGFALFSIPRLLLSGLASSSLSMSFLSTAVVAWLHTAIASYEPRQVIDSLSGLRTQTWLRPDPHNFSRVATCEAVVIVGLIGGLVAVWIYGRTTAKHSERKVEGRVTDYT